MSKILTISVAAYNIEKYIHKMMESIINANCMNDLEILIVDDGSKDETATLAKEYEKRFPVSVKLVSKQNGGHGSTINKGIEVATGKYFRALDGDDWVNSANLYELVSTLKETNVDMVICDYDKCFSDRRVETQRFDDLESMREFSFSEAVKHITWMCYHTIIYRTDILKDNTIQLDEHCFYVDTEYDLFPIPYIKTLLYFDKPVYCYRLGIEGQSVSPESRMKNIDHGKTVAQSLLYFYTQKKDDMSEAQRQYIAFGIADHCTWDIQSFFFFPASRKIRETISEFDQMIKGQSMDVYKGMERLGNDSRIVITMRKTHYYAYWIIKTYKSIKGLFC